MGCLFINKIFIMKYLFLLISTFSYNQIPDHVKDFISKYEPLAQEVFEIYGVPKAVTLGVCAYETGFGRSHNARERKNFFGMKDFTLSCDDKNWCWKRYKNARKSFYDFGRLLSKAKRYESLTKMNKKDYKAWCYGLRNCGYNRSENYPSRLISIIEKWEFAE